jgi:hypothetical protein
MKFSRTWAMPSTDTFSCKPIGDWVKQRLSSSHCSVDPFSRNKRWAKWTNDLNPKTEAEFHMDAEAFLVMLAERNVICDLLILDPPYSPRQISEAYSEAGLKCGMKDTQNSALYKRVKDAAMRILSVNASVLSFGWNTVGMGESRGFIQEEIMLVCHGGAHNDTICLAEIKTPQTQGDFGI